ncbi:hypothetical protein U9M48_040652 [Paspalum notatum var. saurae]|uniref:Uncharacterized protein n=1 Tax=Paspalum notatum var. saurae TaxID=547442 RepID=A0AAQ3ULJ0_PASNO
MAQATKHRARTAVAWPAPWLTYQTTPKIRRRRGAARGGGRLREDAVERWKQPALGEDCASRQPASAEGCGSALVACRLCEVAGQHPQPQDRSRRIETANRPSQQVYRHIGCSAARSGPRIWPKIQPPLAHFKAQNNLSFLFGLLTPCRLPDPPTPCRRSLAATRSPGAGAPTPSRFRLRIAPPPRHLPPLGASRQCARPARPRRRPSPLRAALSTVPPAAPRSLLPLRLLVAQWRW